MFLSLRVIRVIVFFILLFALCRLLFLLSFYSDLGNQPVTLLIGSLWNALPLDISTACYLLFFPILLLLGFHFFRNQSFLKSLHIYCLVVGLLYFLLALGEIGVYREMHVKLYYSAFARVFYPSEILTYLDSTTILLFLVVLFTGAISIYYLLKIFNTPAVESETTSSNKSIIAGLAFFLSATTLTIVGCRGGLQPVAINEGKVCFSLNQYANDAAINPLWNLIHSYIETQKAFTGNAYFFMNEKAARDKVDLLYNVTHDTTISLFTIQRPNVCIIILEGWHADLIEALGGYKDITPHFGKLIDEGYLFTNAVSSGHISDQGLAAILSAYPALTFGSIINQNEKQLKLPSLGKSFGDEGYYTSFLYGGQLMYGGIKKYIYQNKFNSVTEQEDLKKLQAGKVGIHDSLMFDVWLDSIKNFPQPFFSCYFTLSTHVPYDMPTFYPIKWGDGENRYLNSAAYADRQLGRFCSNAKQLSNFDSTIYILVADHGHHTPKNHLYNSQQHYHIPLLLWGGALRNKYKGSKESKIASQVDIASTLLNQVGMDDSEFVWSKNLMNPSICQFAFYTFNQGFGFVDTSGAVVWDKKQATLNMNSGATATEKENLQKNGEAMLQTLTEDFTSR